MNKYIFFAILTLTGFLRAESTNACADVGQRLDNLDYGIPGKADVVLNRIGFATGYSVSKRQPVWVSYRLTANEVTNRVARRTNLFVCDTEVPNPVYSADYIRSFHDRGHIAPAADMAWSKEAMANSFFMSNMSPQKPMFNRGVWKELEHWVRQMAISNGTLFVLSGPIFTTNEVKSCIGPANDIEIPEAYYKVLFKESDPKAMLGLILKNEPSYHNLSHFTCTVDEVETATGLDFFDKLPYDIQTNLESRVDLQVWGWN